MSVAMQSVMRGAQLALVLAIPITALAQPPAAAPGAATNWKMPRTADGHPDLQGTWTSATLTRLERPDQYGARLRLTREEVAKIEHSMRERCRTGFARRRTRVRPSAFAS